jgi:hypothetical protein
MDESPALLAVHLVVGPESDAEEVVGATQQLRRELLDLDVEAVELARAGEPPPGTSSSSVVSCGVKMLELDAGVLGREPPVDTATGTVACRLPR